MRKYLILLVAIATMFFAIPSFADPPQCEGPPDLCAQIAELQKSLDTHKADSEKTASDKAASNRKSLSDRMGKLVGAAASISIVLKMLLSMLKSWKDVFTDDKGKAWLKAITIVIGLALFFITNLGFGMAWWEALILAGGGPGAIAVHELGKLIPVMLGKAKAEPEKKDVPKNEEKPV
jgi:hypothetical protein